MPSLTVKRFAHSSCATPTAAFVFGGYDADAKPLESLETIKVGEKRGILGNSKKKWSKFTLQNSISGRNNALMVVLYSNDILILGGAGNDFEPQSNGVVFDPVKRKVLHKVESSQLRFSCDNQCCIT